MACVTVSHPEQGPWVWARGSFLGLGRGELTNAVYLMPCSSGPSCGERLQQMGAGQKVLKPSFRGTWKLGAFQAELQGPWPP